MAIARGGAAGRAGWMQPAMGSRSLGAVFLSQFRRCRGAATPNCALSYKLAHQLRGRRAKISTHYNGCSAEFTLQALCTTQAAVLNGRQG